ncbi:MAG: efflux RND transporter periplasmic adaptor subunit [Spirochaetaceae bacterium]|nr:MAG: efflux RND transporter periplasmic adaptor subunit [Spirochaetaceae bacterium]
MNKRLLRAFQSRGHGARSTTTTCRRDWSIGSVAVVLLLVALTLAGCGGPPGRGRPGGRDADTAATGDWLAGDRGDRPPRAIEAVEIGRGSLVTRIEGSGRIAGAREATVVTQTQGVVQRVAFDLGGVVQAGDLLAAFDDRSERLAMEQARAQAESAAVELEAARRRQEAGAASAVELARAQATASGAQAAYQRARNAWEERSLRAPIAGRVAAMDPRVTEGNFVPTGVAIARIVDTRSLQMEIAVGEREIAFVAAGASAEIFVDVCGDEAQPGRVRSVAAGSDLSTGSFPVIVEWANRCGDVVRSGMSASVRIVPAIDREVLLIPAAALIRRQGETFVFVVENGTAARRVIEIGRRLGNRTEVTRGLSVGEQVAVSALSALADGDPVEATVIGVSGDLR